MIGNCLHDMIEFEGEILKPEKYPNAACIMVPGDVKAIFGRANPKVKIEFDGVLYRGSIANMGWGPMVVMPQEVRHKVQKVHGDFVHVRIELDTEERVIEIPEMLMKALEANDLVETYNAMSYTNRKEQARSISEAKREETKLKRLEKAIAFVRSKKK